MAPKIERLTRLESVVMDSVWELGQATVRDVKEHLEDSMPRAYNTVLTVMRTLRHKGYLQSRREGRADLYWPAVSRQQAARRPLREVLERFFAGSAQALVSQLLETQDLEAKEIEAIRREVDEKLRESA
jgi:predicted transcriptional regulator